jgi:hypothetical protein
LTGSGALDPLDLNPAAAVNAGRLDWIWPLDLDPAATDACVRPAVGQSRRRAAAAAQGGGARRWDPNLGFSATDGDAEGIHVTRTSKRSEQGRPSRRGCGGAAGDGGGATLNSGEVSWSPWSTNSMTCGAGALLTSLRGSLETSRRRSDGDGKNPTTAALRFRQGRDARGGGRRASHVGGPGGGGQLK